MLFNDRDPEKSHLDPSTFGVDAMGGSFGFIIDSLKVIFKLTPDDNQTYADFLFEKLGALALLVVSLIGLAMAIAFLYFII